MNDSLEECEVFVESKKIPDTLPDNEAFDDSATTDPNFNSTERSHTQRSSFTAPRASNTSCSSDVRQSTHLTRNSITSRVSSLLGRTRSSFQRKSINQRGSAVDFWTT